MRTVVLLALVGIMLAGCVAPSTTPDFAIRNADGTWDFSAIEAGPEDPVFGNPTADVQVVEYSASNCSGCRNYDRILHPTIVADYIDTQRIGYTPVIATIGYKYDYAGGLALECVSSSPPAYAELQSQLLQGISYDRSQEDAQVQYARDRLLVVGAEHGFLTADLESCYDTEAMRSEVLEDMTAFRTVLPEIFDQSLGTPSFVVITESQAWLVNASDLVETIERALA